MIMLELSFNPFPIIETERLILKRFNETDAQDLFLLRSNDECMKYIGKSTHKSIDESIDFIKLKNIGITEGKRIDWAIFYKPEQKIMGSISIHRIEKKTIEAKLVICFILLIGNKELLVRLFMKS